MQQALRVLYHRNVKKHEGDKKKSRATCLAEFAQSLKESLDNSFGFHWHVLVGHEVGFHFKKRDKTAGTWNIDGATMVIVWQSPGIEEPTPPQDSETTADASTSPDADSGRVEGSDGQDAQANTTHEKTKNSKATFKILQPSTIEAGSTTDQTVALLKEELLKSATDDTQILAKDLRRALTEKMGPIWHVVVGKDFVVEAAENRRNFVLMTMGGKMRVLCFQHEQVTGGSSFDWDKLLRTLPYLFVALYCAAYTALQALCSYSTPPESARLAWIYNKCCYDNWNSDLNMYGAFLVGGAFLLRKTRMFTSK